MCEEEYIYVCVCVCLRRECELTHYWYQAAFYIQNEGLETKQPRSRSDGVAGLVGGRALP